MERQLFKLSILILLFGLFNPVYGQNTYYWVGGSGDWGEAIHWSNTSGGLGGSYLLPPSPLDDVIFDQNSGFSPGNNTVTSSISGITCRNMTWDNAPGNPVFEEDPTTDFVLLGNLTLQQNMTFRAQVLFVGNNPAIITSNGGKIGGNIYIDKPNTSVTLADSLMLYHISTTNARTGTIVLVRGTFSLNGHTAYSNGFISEGNAVRHLDITNSIMHFRSSNIGPLNGSQYYYNSAGSINYTDYHFTYSGSNRTVSAANSTIKTEYTYRGVYISGSPQLTFNNFEYIGSMYNSTSSSYYTSQFSNSIVNKIILDYTQHHYISSSSGAKIDTVYFGTSGIPNTNSQGRGITSSNTAFNLVKFLGRGDFSGTNNNIRFLEYHVAGEMTGTGNVMDTLVFSPGYTYRFGLNVNNTVNKKWYASGNPCYFTEIYNIGASGTATITLNQPDPADYDYIRVWGVTAAGSAAPIHAGAHSVDIANNTNFIFDPYSPLSVLYPFGSDTLATCHSDFPITLNTDGFYGNTNTSFVWQDGSTQNSYIVTEPGTYSATADYGRNCYFTATVHVVDQLSVSTAEATPGSSIVCDPSNPNGSLTAVTGGTGASPYTYSWNSTPAQTTQTLTNVPPGNYTVTVTDTTGCSITSSGHLVAGPTDVLDVSISTIYPDCNPSGAGTGYAQSTVSGGIAPYTYTWNTPAGHTTSYADQLHAGTYKLVVTDSLGCTSDTVTFIVPVSATGSFTSSVAVTDPTDCNTTGAAVVTVTGGDAPFQYHWSNDPAETTNTSANIPVGSHNVLIIDNQNCTSNNSFIISSPDSIAPVFSNCPTDTTIYTTGYCHQSLNWIAPTATDNCDSVIITSTHNPGASFPIGLTIVTYTATDLFGNQSTCTFNVTVKDAESPKFALCPNNITITANLGNCSATANWPTPIAADNCGTPTVTGDFTPGSVFPIGITAVTYVATDSHGNTDTCTFNVIVKANPQNFTVTNCPGNRTGYMYWSDISPTDSCAMAMNLSSPSVQNLCGNYWYGTGPNSASPGNNDFPPGVNPVTYYITNGADTLTCSFNVTIYDYAKPMVEAGTAVSNQTIQADTCGGTYFTWTPPVFYDNCEIDSVWSTHQPGDFFTYGTTQIYHYAVDKSGNQSSSSFYLTVNNPYPTIANCPSNMTVSQNLCEGAVVTWTPPTITDNCFTVTSNYNPGDTLPVGQTEVIYTITETDRNNSTSVCSFYVTVAPVQNTVVDCPADINIHLAANKCDTTLTWNAPQFNHPCGIDSITVNQTSGSTFVPGTYPVTYVAYLTDSNDSLVCNFTINITSSIVPITITDCPASGNYTFQVDTTLYCGETPVNWTPPSFTTSACVNPVDTIIYTSSIQNGDTVDIGSYSVSYVAKDSDDNILGQCSFTVNVVDNWSEISVTSCTQDTFIQINGIFSCDSAIVQFTPPVFTHLGCAPLIDTVISNIYPGDTLEKGIYPVTYTALDENGATLASCEFTLEVGDTLTSYTSNCPGVYSPSYGINIYYLDLDPIACTAVADWTVPTFTTAGNCAGFVDTVIQTYGDSIGTIYSSSGWQDMVYYEALDANGAALAICRFYPVVTLNDSLIQFPNDTTFYINSTTCSATVNWDVPAYDNACGISLSYSVNYASSNWDLHGLDYHLNDGNQSFPPGEYQLSYSIWHKDSSINHAITIYVVDSTLPTFNNTCITDTVTLYTNFNVCEATADWIEPTAYSSVCMNGSVIPVTSNHPIGSLLPVGYTTVIYSAESTGGSIATCEFVVEVIDNQPPSIYSCPADILIQADTNCGKIVTWTIPGVFDNCSNVSMTSTHNPGDFFPMGTTVVSYTATDESGNVSTCSFNVTVDDIEGPSFVNCPANILVQSNPDECGATASWTAPSVTNSCTFSIVSSHNPGDYFPIGLTTVTYTATDQNGHAATCTFSVIVQDNHAPVFVDCPPSQMLEMTKAADCQLEVHWTPPTATDNCSVVNVLSNFNTGDKFPVGTTVVTYQAMDNQGLLSVCAFSITVFDPNGYCGDPTTEDSITVKVPDAITPDGDGVNDFLVIQGIESFPNNELVIFNRWGNEVYHTVGYHNEWDGFVNVGTGLEGTQLPTGTYFYILDTKNDSVGVLKGYIYLQR